MAGRRGAAGAGGDRKTDYKFGGMNTEELRRRREDQQVEIRKAKREDSLNKRRNLVDASASAAVTPLMASPAADSPSVTSENVRMSFLY